MERRLSTHFGSEQVATPTSVVLMGVNALVGALWKGTYGAGLAPAAWDYWWVCVPVVVVGAPLGAQFIRFCSRLLLTSMRALLASKARRRASSQVMMSTRPVR